MSLPSTVIRYSIASHGAVTLKLFDMKGRLPRSLVDRIEGPGFHNVRLPSGLARGSYVLTFRTGNAAPDRALVMMEKE